MNARDQVQTERIRTELTFIQKVTDGIKYGIDYDE